MNYGTGILPILVVAFKLLLYITLVDLLNMTVRPKSLNLIRRLNRGNFYLSSQRFQICGIISRMSVMIKYNSV